jgi:hypothetical protein
MARASVRGKSVGARRCAVFCFLPQRTYQFETLRQRGISVDIVRDRVAVGARVYRIAPEPYLRARGKVVVTPTEAQNVEGATVFD